MIPEEREVGGLRCGEVLERLGDFVDGELSAAEVAKVHAHLAGCDVCERFGGEFARTVGGLRRALGEAEALDEAEVERLAAAARKGRP